VNRTQPAHPLTTPGQKLERPSVIDGLSQALLSLIIRGVRTRILALVLLAVGAISGTQPPGQPPAGIQFLGRVLSVDAERHTAIIKHARIPGYAVHGTSAYSVDNDEVLKNLHPDDDIRATVYPNEDTLHNVRVVYRRHK
jgi:hypothetical protein